jgi:hypothetical protein
MMGKICSRCTEVIVALEHIFSEVSRNYINQRPCVNVQRLRCSCVYLQDRGAHAFPRGQWTIQSTKKVRMMH